MLATVGGGLGSPAAVLIAMVIGPVFGPVLLISAVVAFGLAALGVMWLFQEVYFEYDARSFRIRAIKPWSLRLFRKWHRSRSHPVQEDRGEIYPDYGFVRLEYSADTGEIYQVSQGGRRERMWLRVRWAEPSDWQAFVQTLERIGAIAPEGPEPC
jgi:hypothetical protein